MFLVASRKGGSFQCTTSSETSLLPTGLQEGVAVKHHTETMFSPKNVQPGLKGLKNKNDIEEAALIPHSAYG